jgi:release factor glutamine methyltransferase
VPAVATLAARLAAAGCVAADDEARELLLDAPDSHELDARVRRREDGEPLAWITGRVRFGGLDLHIAPGVYVPRPQSEDLARRAAALLPARGLALDLCTGSGAIAAWMRRAVPTARVVAVDVDVAAVRCARANGVPSLLGDLAEAVRAAPVVDVVTAVAPYVPSGVRRLLPADVQRHEPAHALDGGPDGLDVVRRVVAAAAARLVPGGHLLVEVGGDQHAELDGELCAHGFDAAHAWRDDEGDVRGVVARLARPSAPGPVTRGGA